MALPFTPEELDKLQARYTDALIFTYVVAVGMVYTPGMCRDNVFDGTDGIRLIISKEQAPSIGEVLHVTASHEPELFYKVFPRKIAPDEYMKAMTDKFVAISGDDRKLKFVGLTGAGIPHWIIQLRK